MTIFVLYLHIISTFVQVGATFTWSMSKRHPLPYSLLFLHRYRLFCMRIVVLAAPCLLALLGLKEGDWYCSHPQQQRPGKWAISWINSGNWQFCVSRKMSFISDIGRKLSAQPASIVRSTVLFITLYRDSVTLLSPQNWGKSVRFVRC